MIRNAPPILDTDYAWAAGLFEGEGWFHLADNGGVQMGLSMTDADVVARFSLIMGAGSIRPYDPPNPKHKRQHRWVLCGWDAVPAAVARIQPWLGSRRSRRWAEIAAARPQRRLRSGSNQTHCIHGHEFSEENTRWTGGRRQCRACDRERKAARA